MTLANNKSALRSYTDALRNPGAGIAKAVDNFFAPDADINVVHPFNNLQGSAQYQQQFLSGLQESFDLLCRNDYIAMAGEYESGEWVACSGNYSGNFNSSWLGIKPTGALAHFRFAEFHRMQQGVAVESYIFLDLPALMMAAGVWPITDIVARHQGYTGYIPGPVTQDGLLWQHSDSSLSQSTLKLTEDMLLNLATEDERWRPYWHEHMNWYGPAAFGAFYGKEEFAGFQMPFENSFSEWISGIMPNSKTSHFLRMADGNYSCLGGWPSLNLLQAKTFLGQPVQSQRLYMRVCDLWRRDGDLLAENWVIVDMPHFLLQMGYDVFAKLGDVAP